MGKGQEATGGQQKEEKNIAQQEVQQKENRAESVDSHLLEFIIEADINTQSLYECIFFYIHFCNIQF